MNRFDCKLGNCVITLTSVVLRENNWISVMAIFSFLMQTALQGKTKEDEARSILHSQYFRDHLSNEAQNRCVFH